jgi:hypothetical protein
LPRGVQIVAASFEDRTAVACAAMLDALGASFSPADGFTSNAANASCKLGELERDDFGQNRFGIPESARV